MRFYYCILLNILVQNLKTCANRLSVGLGRGWMPCPGVPERGGSGAGRMLLQRRSRWIVRDKRSRESQRASTVCEMCYMYWKEMIRYAQEPTTDGREEADSLTDKSVRWTGQSGGKYARDDHRSRQYRQRDGRTKPRDLLSLKGCTTTHLALRECHFCE